MGGPVALGVFGALAFVALVAWLAGALLLVVAAPQLAAHDLLAWQPVLAAHLVALGLLPPAVTAAAFHLLPVMLRNDLRRPRLLRLVPIGLASGPVAAVGISRNLPFLLWPSAALLTCGLAVVLVELVGLAVRAPRGRTLVTSRVGVLLVCAHVLAALVLGAVVFAHGDRSSLGVTHDRWVLVHLHLAVLGWLTLLIVTVARTLGPMLALAPAAPPRRLPLTELVLSGGLWLLVAGIALGAPVLEVAGAAAVIGALVGFAARMAPLLARRRLPLEAPLAHLAVGAVFLVQAAILGLAVATTEVSPGRALGAYVVLLLVGFAGGMTLGHLGKLLSLSIWVWWPPGPRPKQEDLYPRRLWLVEASAFAVGVELLALGALAGAGAVARAGAVLLVLAAVLAATASARTWSRRPGRTEYAAPL
ncbi:MAG TPA: hypothetical protein VNC40_05940 [Gaiellaceae bacterium]|nr:hypothetical protein [Gaiellaceae bacterium]